MTVFYRFTLFHEKKRNKTVNSFLIYFVSFEYKNLIIPQIMTETNGTYVCERQSDY